MESAPERNSRAIHQQLDQQREKEESWEDRLTMASPYIALALLLVGLFLGG